MIVVAVGLVSGSAVGDDNPPNDDDALVVMTYNLRYASPTPPNSWPQRRPVAKAMIDEQRPDLIGTQEGLYGQLKDLDADVPDYDWIGLGRDGGSRGEFMAVFYRRERLEPLAYDHFWLSDTPEVIASVTWGHTCRRMVTWVKFRDRVTGRRFYFFNTHFDHESRRARRLSAQLVLRRVLDLKTELPVVLVGDFNSAAQNSQVYETLVGENAFRDTWLTAAKRGERLGTFHGYHTPRPDGARIDWILLRGPIKAKSTRIVTFARNGQYPSDHFPVVARLLFSEK